jgi:hypothetical protein
MRYLTILLGAKGFVVISYFLQYPYVQKESHSSFVLSQTIFVVYLFGIINVDYLLYKLGQT